MLCGAVFIVGIPQHVGQASVTFEGPVAHPGPVAVVKNAKLDLVKHELERKMTKATPSEVQAVTEVIIAECEKTGFDPLFILAIIEGESNYDIEAVSETKSMGLMQLQPATFRQMSSAKRMLDPVENVRAGIRYVRHLWDAGFGKRGGPESILLAYNQGPKTALDVFKNEVPMPEEAARYVPDVMSRYRNLLTKHGYKAKEAKKLFLASR